MTQSLQRHWRAGATGTAHLFALTLLLVLLNSPALAAPKTDVLVLINGDRMTGEVDQLSYGQLTYKTDHMGTIYVEWDKVVSLKTTQVLQVELADGRRFFGQAPEAAAEKATLRLVTGSEGAEPAPVLLAMSDILRIATTTEAKGFYNRLEGSVSAGYSFAQANSVEVATLAAEVSSRSRTKRWKIAFDGQATSQESAPSSERGLLTFSLEHFMPDRYFREEVLAFSTNQELGLDLRSLIGGIYGRYLMQDQHREWRAGAGLAASKEKGTDGTRRNNLEADLSTDLRLFHLDSPKMNVTATVSVLPSLSDWGRVRGEGTIKARREIVSDLFFELSFNDSYDNSATEGAKSNDWDVSTSIGYTF
jgi:hypothetical protein